MSFFIPQKMSFKLVKSQLPSEDEKASIIDSLSIRCEVKFYVISLRIRIPFQSI